MRNYFFLVIILITIQAGARWLPIDKNIIHQFHQSFPSAQQVEWYETNHQVQVYFKLNELKCRIWYDENGTILKVIRYYTEEQLSPFIRTRVNQQYPDQKIFGIIETTTGDTFNYEIILEDEDSWYHIKSDAYGWLTRQAKFHKRK
ncbi:MAG TPA: hypothetical protein VFQ58_04495 [Flavisolibacter sp.]|jgi:hypothetical protein|nr:hypothetical protein [Flavisolibacter sp.]